MTERSVSASPPYGSVESFARILRKSVKNPDNVDGCALSLVQALAVDEYLEASMKVERIVNVIAAATVVSGELRPDPTGQLYSRAAEDPQPSAGRVPAHHEDGVTGAVIEVANGHVVHGCCGKLDDAPHENYCEHWRPCTTPSES